MTAAGFCPMAARTPAPRGETGSSGAPPDHPGGAPDFFFIPLWIYTALKPSSLLGPRPSWLCTPLDLHSSQTQRQMTPTKEELCTPLDLHSSQTELLWRDQRQMLCTPLDLHSSQTCVPFAAKIFTLCTPLDLHSSQTYSTSPTRTPGFVPLWIYTALKQGRRLGWAAGGLCTPLDLHSSQTSSPSTAADSLLCTSLDLHSSQTARRTG